MRRQQIAAHAPDERTGAALPENDESSLSRVGQRDRSVEDLVGERGDVELSGKGESQVVERFELEKTRLDLELRILDEPGEPARRQDRPEDPAERGRQLLRLFVLDALERETAVGLPFRVERYPQPAAVRDDVFQKRLRRLDRHALFPGVESEQPTVPVAKVDGRAAGPDGGERGLGDPDGQRLVGLALQRRERPGEAGDGSRRAQGILADGSGTSRRARHRSVASGQAVAPTACRASFSVG